LSGIKAGYFKFILLLFGFIGMVLQVLFYFVLFYPLIILRKTDERAILSGINKQYELID